jgi:predicted Ser/Thr protein kinase
MRFIYIIDYDSAIKRKNIKNLEAKWMELETSIMSEVIQTQKDMYSTYSLISSY